MNRRILLALVIAATGAAAGCSPAGDAGSAASGAETALFEGVDRYHRPITTTSAEAQRWFDQGLQLVYGFNHDEAIRSFREAARLDPDAPMPWWGIAYAHGININDPEMTDERWQAAAEAAAEAMRRREGAAPVEVALIEAVAKRYSWPAPEVPRVLDEAYAAAMGEAWHAFPEDPDVGTLYAESLMNLQPWDYWTAEGQPKGRIEEVEHVLEAVRALDLDHPGANHFYIHAMEASADPYVAADAADRLRNRVPGAGHLVHMPSHIYIRTGRYADAADANERAVAADRAYFENATEPDIYGIYYAHNLHFLAFAAMMEGRYDVALEAARDLEREIPEKVLRAYAGLIEGIMPTTFHVMIRFGRWEEILDEPERPDYRIVTRAVRRYARGIALSALGRTDEAREEIEAFEQAVAVVPDEWYVFNNRVHQVLPIARAMLEGELAFREGRLDEAFAALRRGVEFEDALVYDEPPAWMLPVRHSLGALLTAAGRFAEAETVYREDLRRNPDNGWALTGLQRALAGQGKSEEAAGLAPRLEVAWQRAEEKPTVSCYCALGARTRG